MTSNEIVSWVEWLNWKKDQALQDAKRYRKTGEWSMQRGCEMKAVAYGEMLDKITRGLSAPTNPL